MGKIINWFRVKFDRNTHDAKFQLFTGNCHQEINLQVQAELDKTSRRLNECIIEIDALRETNTNLQNDVESTKAERDNLLQFIKNMNELSYTTSSRLNDYIIEIDALRETNSNLQNELSDVKSERDDLLHVVKETNELRSSTMSFKIKHPECGVARLHMCYGEYKTLLDAVDDVNSNIKVQSSICLLDTNNPQTVYKFILHLIKTTVCDQKKVK